MAPALLMFFLGLAITTSEADPNYIYHICSNNITFTTNSTYQFNLNLLLSSLASKSTHNNNGFYKTTIGQTPDTVYGLFLCRGDVSTDVCQDCVTFATQDVVQRCPIGKATQIWYYQCLLRYSNRYFFNNVSQGYPIMRNSPSSTTLTGYQDLLRATMDDRASQASRSGLKFDVRATKFPWSFGYLYTLAQCTQDLSEGSCEKCLRFAISRLPNGSIGAMAMTSSCIIRYETYLFYNPSAVRGRLSVSLPLPPLSPSPTPLYLPPPPRATRKGNF